MRGSELIEAYVAGIESIERAVRGLNAEQVRARPGPGAWSVLEVACHVADSEGLFADRMKRVLAEERPALAYSDESRAVAALVYHERDVEEEVGCIRALRQQMARILRAQPAEVWGRIGIHSRDGEQTLEQLLRKAVTHLEHHVGFIREKRKALEGAAALP